MIPYSVSIKFMIGGYAVILLIIAFYLTSMVMRWRRLKRDLEYLKDIKK